MNGYEPMKAVLWDEPFSDPDWIFERKLDGVRCLAHRHGDGVRLVSRTDRGMNGDYPELVEALEAEPCEDFVDRRRGGGVRRARDHELLAAPAPSTASEWRSSTTSSICCGWRGEDVRALPLRQRKAQLRRALRFEGHVRFSPHRNEDGEELFRDACRKGLEGVMAKRADSPYRATRSSDWRKLKCHAEQELVIGGYTAPQGSRTDFGALLVGYFEDGG